MAMSICLQINRLNTTRKVRYKLQGGPYSGELVLMPIDLQQTVVFSATMFDTTGLNGKYVRRDKNKDVLLWVDVPRLVERVEC